jgi:hypothetical protein
MPPTPTAASSSRACTAAGWTCGTASIAFAESSFATTAAKSSAYALKGGGNGMSWSVRIEKTPAAEFNAAIDALELVDSSGADFAREEAQAQLGAAKEAAKTIMASGAVSTEGEFIARLSGQTGTGATGELAGHGARRPASPRLRPTGHAAGAAHAPAPRDSSAFPVGGRSDLIGAAPRQGKWHLDSTVPADYFTDDEFLRALVYFQERVV